MIVRLVVAGTSKQCAEYIMRFPKAERPHFKEMKSVYNLVGWENVEVHLVGSWEERRDAKAMMAEVIKRMEQGKILQIIKGGANEQKRIR